MHIYNTVSLHISFFVFLPLLQSLEAIYLQDCLCSAGRGCGLRLLSPRLFSHACELLCEEEMNRWPKCRLYSNSVKRHRFRDRLHGRMNAIECEGMEGLICKRLICEHCLSFQLAASPCAHSSIKWIVFVQPTLSHLLFSNLISLKY